MAAADPARWGSAMAQAREIQRSAIVIPDPELVDDTEIPNVCPCGQPSVLGQTWRTGWFDDLGIPTRIEVTKLCGDHRARTWHGPYVGHMDCARFGCGPEHCEWPDCRPDAMGQQ